MLGCENPDASKLSRSNRSRKEREPKGGGVGCPFAELGQGMTDGVDSKERPRGHDRRAILFAAQRANKAETILPHTLPW